MPVILFPVVSPDPSLSQQGDRGSIPRGVESIFEYNGYRWNDRTLVDKVRVTSIEGLDDGDVRDSREDNPADDGETPYESFYGGRTLVFNGRIEAYELFKLREMQEDFKAAFIDLAEKRLYFRTESPEYDHFINCRKFSKIQMGDEQSDVDHFFREYQLTVRASNPRFLRSQPKVYVLYPNRVVDPGFEGYQLGSTGAPDWVDGSNGQWSGKTLQIKDDWASEGMRSLAVGGTYDAASGASGASGTTGVFTPSGTNGFPIYPDTKFAAEITAYAFNASNVGARVGISWYDANGGLIDSVNGNYYTGLGKKRLLVKGESPPTAAYASIRFEITSTSSPDVVDYRIDNARFAQYENESDPISTVSFENEGNYFAQPVFKIYGPMTRIEFKNENSLDEDGNPQKFILEDEAGIDPGDIYTADATKKTLKNKVGQNKFDDLADSSEWIKIVPGDNLFSIDPGKCIAADIDSRIEIRFRDSWF